MNKITLKTILILFALSCLSAEPLTEWKTLLRRGDEAYARGDFTAAATLYEQAGERTTEPGLVTFNLAAAQFRLALSSDADRARLARQAEQSYRCCIQPGDPRRTQALFGLGNALLLRADGRDADALKAAVESYQQCLLEANIGGELTDNVRYNLERVRLLLLQRPPAAAHTKDESSGDAPPKPQPPREKPGSQRNTERDSSTGTAKPDKGGDPAKPEKGEKPIETDLPPSPGAGHLPPVPDGADLPPLSAEDAARHLELASQRIEEDYKSHRRSKARAPAANVRDW